LRSVALLILLLVLITVAFARGCRGDVTVVEPTVRAHLPTTGARTRGFGAAVSLGCWRLSEKPSVRAGGLRLEPRKPGAWLARGWRLQGEPHARGRLIAHRRRRRRRRTRARHTRV
jgi:hypothetical protein